MVETSAAIPGSLVWGHACLAACAALYLAWWWTFFNPSLPKATGALYATGVGFIVGAVILGIAVVALIVAGLAGLGAGGRGGLPVPVWAFAVGGICAYFALVFATTRIFGRPVTTELLLFVLWAALEFAVLNALAGSGALAAAAAVGLAAAVVAVFVGCLACYLLYFRLQPLPSFVAGALPLLVVGVFAAIMAIVIARL